MSIKKAIYDMTLTPYYKAMISKDGEIVKTVIIKKTDTNLRYFRVKKYKASFMLPDHKRLSEAGVRILKDRSGYLLSYDLRDITPMRLKTMDDDGRFYEESITSINARGFAPSPLSTEELHDFIDAKIVEDILADEREGIPMWLIYLVSLGLIVALILGAFYMLTKGQEPVYIPAQPGIIPTPTPGYIIVP